MALINVKSKTDLSGFWIIYNGSVRNEKKGWRGLSHLMEHLLFHHVDDMLDSFDMDGINYNAYTADNEIAFYFTGLDEYLKKYRKKILDKLLKFNISEKIFENEKKIVSEEIKDYFNKQNYSHQLNLNRKLFNDFGPIGSLSDIENITYSDIKEYFDVQFLKPSKIINVSKNSDFKADIEFNNKKFDQKIILGDYNVPIEKYTGKNGKSSVINISEPLEKDFAYCSFITDMLGNGLKSPLYQEIREKRGLVYYISSYISRTTNKSGIITFLSETSDDNVDEYQDTLKDVLDNPKKYMTKERFDIVKKSLEIQLKKNEINRFSNVGKYITPEEWRIEPILKDITLDKMMEVYDKYFKYDKLIKSIDTRDEFLR